MGAGFVWKNIGIGESAARANYFSNSGVGKSLVVGAIRVWTCRVVVAIVLLWKVAAYV